ncbi:MAG: hypothetical protein AAGA47_06100 [Pseudomonadota bacterium]
MARKPTTVQKLTRYGILMSVGLVAFFGLQYAANSIGMADTAGRSIAIGLLVGGVIGVGGAMLGIIGTDDEDA